MRKIFLVAAVFAASLSRADADGEARFVRADVLCGAVLAAHPLEKPDIPFLAMVRGWRDCLQGKARYAPLDSMSALDDPRPEAKTPPLAFVLHGNYRNRTFSHRGQPYSFRDEGDRLDHANRLELLVRHAEDAFANGSKHWDGEGFVRLPIPEHALLQSNIPQSAFVPFQDAVTPAETGPTILGSLVGYATGLTAGGISALATNVLSPDIGNAFFHWATPALVGAGVGGLVGLMARYWMWVRRIWVPKPGYSLATRLIEHSVGYGGAQLPDGRYADVFFHNNAFYFYFWR